MRGHASFESAALAPAWKRVRDITVQPSVDEIASDVFGAADQIAKASSDLARNDLG
jgi:hypothetical protein